MDQSKITNKLSEDQLYVLRDKGTEAPFSGEYLSRTDSGSYDCAACGTLLFSSADKFDSSCGWPSFSDVANSSNVILLQDTTHGMVRTEVTCANCGGHLGHLFDDAPDQPTGLRYCINSVSLDFTPSK